MFDRSAMSPSHLPLLWLASAITTHMVVCAQLSSLGQVDASFDHATPVYEWETSHPNSSPANAIPYPIPGTSLLLRINSHPAVDPAVKPLDLSFVIIGGLYGLYPITDAAQGGFRLSHGDVNMTLVPYMGLTRRDAFQSVKGLADWLGEENAFRTMNATIIRNGLRIGRIKVEKY